jgi:tripartite motif-containing protein 71
MGIHRRSLLSLLATLALVLIALPLGAQAEAQGGTGYIFSSSWNARPLGGRLNNPLGITVGSDGNVYVADSDNNRIQAFSKAGEFIRRWGALGDTLGKMAHPGGTLAADGKIYVADSGNGRIQTFTPRGRSPKVFATGMATPRGMAMNASGELYVADSARSVVHVFSPEGAPLRTIGRRGAANGQFSSPRDVAIGPGDDVYVADFYNHRVQVFSADGTFLHKLDQQVHPAIEYPAALAFGPDGRLYVGISLTSVIVLDPQLGVVGLWGQYGSGNGQLNWIEGLDVGPDGTVYVLDSGNDRVQAFSGTGTYLRQFGSHGIANRQFSKPYGVAISSDGTAYVADRDNHRIQALSPTGAFLRKWGSKGTAPGQFNKPVDVAVGPNGNVHVVDADNRRVQVFTPTGQFVRQMGSGQLGAPQSLAVGVDGKIFVVDSSHDNVRVYRPDGALYDTWGSAGSGDGQLDGPSGIALGRDGSVYVVDTGNLRIQVFTPAGAFLHKWGSSGTGPGQFLAPRGISLLGDMVYVADSWHHAIKLFRTDGTYLGIIGGRRGYLDGSLNYPQDVVAAGTHLYIADRDNNRIQVFTKKARIALPLILGRP